MYPLLVVYMDNKRKLNPENFFMMCSGAVWEHFVEECHVVKISGAPLCRTGCGVRSFSGRGIRGNSD